MSTGYYLGNKSVHDIPKFNSKIRHIQVGNKWPILQCIVIIPVTVSIHGLTDKIHTFASETHDNVELVPILENTYDLVVDLSIRDLCFKFLNKSISLYANEVILTPKQMVIKVEAPFSEEFSGLFIF